jgi:hypothetical protein
MSELLTTYASLAAESRADAKRRRELAVDLIQRPIEERLGFHPNSLIAEAIELEALALQYQINATDEIIRGQAPGL